MPSVSEYFRLQLSSKKIKDDRIYSCISGPDNSFIINGIYQVKLTNQNIILIKHPGGKWMVDCNNCANPGKKSFISDLMDFITL